MFVARALCLSTILDVEPVLKIFNPRIKQLAPPVFTQSIKNIEGYGRKEMFYLTTHSTHFIYLYGVGIKIVYDHSGTERGNPLPLLHGLLFLINSKNSFYMYHPIDRIAHTTAFVTQVVEHWREQENSSKGAP